MVEPLYESLWQHSQQPTAQYITATASVCLLTTWRLLLRTRPTADTTSILSALATALIFGIWRFITGDNFLTFFAVGVLYWTVVFAAPALLLFRKHRMRWAALAFGVATLTYTSHVELKRLQTTTHHFTFPGTPPLRIGVVSDLQASGRSSIHDALLEQFETADVDLLLFTGDYLNGTWYMHPDAFMAAKNVITQLDAPYGGLAVTGHTDTVYGHETLFADTPTDFVRNEVRWLSIDGKRIAIVAIDQFTPEPPPRPNADLVIAFFHSPDLLLELPDGYADLAIAGHTHGGQLVVPGFGPLTTLTKLGRAFDRGVFKINAQWTAISAGIGVEGFFAPPVRAFCPPELMVLDLKPGAEAAYLDGRPKAETVRHEAPSELELSKRGQYTKRWPTDAGIDRLQRPLDAAQSDLSVRFEPASVEGLSPHVGQDAKHAVVIVIDTLRADRAAKADTPNLDAMSAESVTWKRAWTTSTWTVPSVISLFTGTFVRTHGWDRPTGELDKAPSISPLRPTIAETLKAEGFETYGYFANAYLAKELGFDRGYDRWQKTNDAQMAKWVRQTLETSDPTTRKFFYLHLLGPHSGLNPSPEKRAKYDLESRWFDAHPQGLLIGRAKRDREPGVRAAYSTAYDAAIEDTDQNLGQLLEALEPIREHAAIIITSDHGEELGERGVFGHGWSVAETLTHVPMLASIPGVAPHQRETGTLAELTDLVTDSLGLEVNWPVQHPWTGPLVSERHGKSALLAEGRWKGEWNAERLTVYDLANDLVNGIESSDAQKAERIIQLRTVWQALVPEGRALQATERLEDETIQQIKALGYAD